MRNPFDLTKNDDEFVVASQTKNSRQAKITQLTVGRNWALVTLILQSGFVALLLALDWRSFNDNATWWLFAYALNAISFAHFDLQIKFLKALETGRNEV